GKGRRRQKFCYPRGTPATKNVTFGNDTVVIISPEPDQTATLSKHRPIQPAADVSPTVHAEIAQNKEPEQVHVRFADVPEPYPHPDPHPRANPPCPTRHEAGPVYMASSYRYMPSPLPRWDEGERRRPEYFGGEYRYYPTPVREGIYSIATDANRLTTIFSEENPNACSIV
ncbi:hypothetical protein COCNU_05G009600, partial [Cocos nucifera]